MKNLPDLKRSGQVTALALAFTSLGASLMLLLGNHKAIVEFVIKVDGVQFRIDTRSRFD